MKIEKNRQYFTISVYAFVTALAVIVCYLILSNIAGVRDNIKSVIDVFLPVIWGISLAYILNPLMVWLERRASRANFLTTKRKLRRAISVLLTFIFFVGLLAGFFTLVIPELSKSISGLIANLSYYLSNIEFWVTDFLTDYLEKLDVSQADINTMLSPILERLGNIGEYISMALEAIFNFLVSATLSITNFIIAMIIAIYLLAGKETFVAQLKKLLYAFSNPAKSQYLLDLANHTNRIFNGYISGNILDSIIVGILTFTMLTVLKIDYAVLIGVIVGVTNIIPFFGPFIGAIPSALLLLVVDPKQFLIFIILILVIQQVDGNIIKPKILGDSTGLSSFWVIFAVTVAGGLFGIVGMFIGVPVFAVCYAIFKAYIENRLTRKGLAPDSLSYRVEPEPPPPKQRRKDRKKAKAEQKARQAADEPKPSSDQESDSKPK